MTQSHLSKAVPYEDAAALLRELADLYDAGRVRLTIDMRLESDLGAYGFSARKVYDITAREPLAGSLLPGDWA